MLQCRAWQGRGRFWWSCSEAGAALHLAPTLPVPGIFQPLFTFPCSLRAPLCLSLRWITGKGEVASSGFRFCFIINCGQMSLEDQHGVGWAVEGDWTASPVCVPRGSIWAPEHQCLSRARECVHSLGGNPRGCSRALASTKPLPDVLQAEDPLSCAWSLRPLSPLYDKARLLWEEKNKSWEGGTLSGSGQAACPVVAQEAGAPGCGQAPWGWGGQCQGPALVCPSAPLWGSVWPERISSSFPTSHPASPSLFPPLCFLTSCKVFVSAPWPPSCLSWVLGAPLFPPPAVHAATLGARELLFLPSLCPFISPSSFPQLPRGRGPQRREGMGGRGTTVGKEGPPTCPAVAAARTQSTWLPLQLPVRGPGPG